jgi:hypothetical protein
MNIEVWRFALRIEIISSVHFQKLFRRRESRPEHSDNVSVDAVKSSHDEGL